MLLISEKGLRAKKSRDRMKEVMDGGLVKYYFLRPSIKFIFFCAKFPQRTKITSPRSLNFEIILLVKILHPRSLM